nr:uncharacterized protein LOC109189653 [Ipomoea batatas]
MVKARRWRNKVVKLKNEDGVWVHDTDAIGIVMVDYFAKLFTAENGEMEEVILCIQSSVKSKDNARLVGPVKDTIRLGCRRYISDGRGTIIGTDPWLVYVENPFVTTDLHESISNATVSSLLSENGSGWDAECVRDIFNERDANVILNIPVSLRKPPDIWIWKDEAKGIYSVNVIPRILLTLLFYPKLLTYMSYDLPILQKDFYK